MSERLSSHQPEKVEYVLLPKARERAQKLKTEKMKGRDLDDFVGGPVTQEVINSYKEKVVALDGIFAKQNEEKTPEERMMAEHAKEMADCLEGVFLNTPSWFGLGSKLFPTTKWDDYKNGVDMVAERREGELVNHHGFALDITYGGTETIIKKMSKIANNIVKGKLGHVDFFKSADGRYKGQLGEVPLVVIGADANTMKGMVNHFANSEDNALVLHPFQFQMIEQVILQCDFYIEVAGRCTDVGASMKIIEAYTRLKSEFESLLKVKAKTIPEVDRNYRDAFHANMLYSMEHVDRTLAEKYGDRIIGNENF